MESFSTTYDSIRIRPNGETTKADPKILRRIFAITFGNSNKTEHFYKKYKLNMGNPDKSDFLQGSPFIREHSAKATNFLSIHFDTKPPNVTQKIH